MFTVVIPTFNSQAVLTHTLAGLVSAAADGAVREVVVADSGSTDSTADIADATGCLLFEAGETNTNACRDATKIATRGHWLLFLDPGVSLEPGWHHDALAFAEKAERSGRGQIAGVFRYAVDDIGLPARLKETGVVLERLVTGLPRGTQGLLISRTFYEDLGGHKPLGLLSGLDLARRIGRRRLYTLRARSYLPQEFASTTIAPGFLARGLIAAGLPSRLIRMGGN